MEAGGHPQIGLRAMGGQRYVVRLCKRCKLRHLGNSAGIAAVRLNNVDDAFREIRKYSPNGSIAFAASEGNLDLLLDTFKGLDVARDGRFFEKEEVVGLNGG